MPWTCGQCGNDVERDDATACPDCQAPKTAWTMVKDTTRRFVLTKARLEAYRGQSSEGAPSEQPPSELTPEGWQPTERAPAVPLAQARAWEEAGQRPPEDALIKARVVAKSARNPRLLLTVNFAQAEAREQEHAPDPEPESAPWEAHLLCVCGVGEGEALPSFPGLVVLDVSEGEGAGHAPSLEVARKKSALTLQLEPYASSGDLQVVRVLDVFLSGSAWPQPRYGGDEWSSLAAPLAEALRALEAAGEGATLAVAGHADPSGDAAKNHALSAQRAEALRALLMGEREAFAAAVREHHGVVCLQANLDHFAEEFLWPELQPGKIDDKWGPITQSAVSSFQRAFKEARQTLELGEVPAPNDEAPASHPVDEVTLGAFCDLVGWLLRCALGLSGEELAQRRAAIAWAEPATLALGDSFPLEGEPEERSRRVELLILPAEGAPPLTCPGEARRYERAEVPAYGEDTTQQVLEVPPWRAYVLDLRTVDELGRALPSVELELGGEAIQTDAVGYWRRYGVEAKQGKLTLRSPAGERLRFAEQEGEGDPELDVRLGAEAVTSVTVLGRVPAEILEQQRRYERIVRRRPPTEGEPSKVTTRRTDAPAPTQEGTSSAEPEQDTALASRRYCADPVALAVFGNERSGDFALPHAEMVQGLDDWLSDYHPNLTGRGWWLNLLVGTGEKQLLMVYDRAGSLHYSWELPQADTVRGLYGAYAPLESGRGFNYYRDLSELRYGLRGPSDTGRFELTDFLSPAQADAWRAHLRSQAGALPVVYHAPTHSRLFQVALFGGSGQLEPYTGGTALTRASVHRRNLGCCRAIDFAYRGYAKGYLSKLEGCKTEADVRRLGPPRAPSLYRLPVDAKLDELKELSDAQQLASNQEFELWQAIGQKLSVIWNEPLAGKPFLVVKHAHALTTGTGTVKVEHCITWDPDRGTLKKKQETASVRVDMTKVGKLGGKLGKRKIPVGAGFEGEVDLETGETKQKLHVKLGALDSEFASDGGVKITRGVATGEMNLFTGEVGQGATLKLEGLPYEPELYVGLHWQLAKPDDVLAWTSNAPGFFERRSTKELLETARWGDLNRDERDKLELLGFDQESWDARHVTPLVELPEAVRQDPQNLEAAQEIATIHLGFSRTGWKPAWQALAKKK